MQLSQHYLGTQAHASPGTAGMDPTTHPTLANNSPNPYCRRVANIYFTLVAALSLTPYSPVRCAVVAMQSELQGCCHAANMLWG